MFPFEKFEIYNKSKYLHKRISVTLEKHTNLPSFYANQLLRASLSIIANVAEGSGRSTNKDKCHFYIMAKGSTYETVAIVDTLYDLGTFTSEERNQIYNLSEEIVKMLTGLTKSLYSK